jgi:hypothetical protein
MIKDISEISASFLVLDTLACISSIWEQRQPLVTQGEAQVG